MRVAYLINQYPKVSHTFIRREIEALERRGVEVLRIALRGWDEDLPDEGDQAERMRTRYVLREGLLPLLWDCVFIAVTRPLCFLRTVALAWRTSRGGERPFPVHLAYVAEACRIVRWLKASDATHLHAHFGTNPAAVAMFVGTLGGPPFSFTVHGPEEFDKAASIALVDKVIRAKFTVTISSYGRGQLYRIVPEEYWQRIHVIHCGLDPNFSGGEVRSVPDSRRLVCVGRLTPQKGQLLLLEAAKRLADRGVDFTLVLAGDGEMRPQVETAILRANLQDRIHITGWISGVAVREEILASRAMVLPSLAEGLPVVLVEAMALKRPVISTYVAGIPELVLPRDHGWLVPAGDEEALADAIVACLGTPAVELSKMGEAASTRARTRHNIESAAIRLAELFCR